MAELALDDDQRYALAGHLDGVRVTAARAERSAAARRPVRRRVVAGRARRFDHARPRRGPGDDAKQRADGKFGAGVEPRLELLPGPLVHADLAAAAALAAPHEQRPAPAIEVALVQQQGLVDVKTGAPQHDTRPRRRCPCSPLPAWRLTRHISSIVGGAG
ncbi:MAG: hypothetical protein M3N47_11965 [Chloroflexota bacterium]|nr:hypothetical protein [Chloroflexota bacterium]